jgi:hypothetical protein
MNIEQESHLRALRMELEGLQTWRHDVWDEYLRTGSTMVWRELREANAAISAKLQELWRARADEEAAGLSHDG